MGLWWNCGGVLGEGEMGQVGCKLFLYNNLRLLLIDKFSSVIPADGERESLGLDY